MKTSALGSSVRLCSWLVATAMGVAACGGPARPPGPAAPAHASGARLAGQRLIIDDLEGLALFDDELANARVILGDWARKQGATVIDPARTSEALARAQRGEDPRTAAACGRPLGHWEARRRWATELGADRRLTASVGCDEARYVCSLQVAVSGLDWDDDPDIDAASKNGWSASFDASAAWREALPRALAKVSPAPADEGAEGLFGIGGVGGGTVSARPEHLEVSTSSARAGDRDESFKDALVLSDVSALRACMGGADSAELLVASDAGGHITRCESRNWSDATSRCACDVFKARGSAKPSAAAARFYVNVSYNAADVVAQGKAVVSASIQTSLVKYQVKDGSDRWKASVTDPSIEDWRAPRSRFVAACFGDLTSGTIHLRLQTTFDAGGRAVHATARPAKGESPTAAQITCVERAFLRAEAPCPEAANARADALVEVSARRLTGGT